MSIVYLVVAIIFEVLGTTCMKMAEGFTRPVPSVGMAVFYTLSFVCLGLTLKEMEVSTVYAIWSGVGMALIAAIGVLVFKESFTPMKLVSLTLIVAGVVGLNLSGGAH